MTSTYLKTSLPTALESSKLLLLLARRAHSGAYTPEDGQSPYHLLVQWLEHVESHAEEVGLDWDETELERARLQKVEEEREKERERLVEEGARVGGKLMRIDGPMKVLSPADIALQTSSAGGKGKGKPPPKEKKEYKEEEDPSSTSRMDVERIVLEDGLGVYKDQAGRLWTGLATYWIKRGEFERVRSPVLPSFLSSPLFLSSVLSEI